MCLEWLQYVHILFQYIVNGLQNICYKKEALNLISLRTIALWHPGMNALVGNFSMINLEIILIEQLFPMRKIVSRGFLNMW